jgi:hypothetical protein
MHCYAVRGQYMRKLYGRLLGGGEFNASVHCDWIMGRDPELQRSHKVYAPNVFLVGQERGVSDINGHSRFRMFWSHPSPDTPVIYLKAPVQVARGLMRRGLYFGGHAGRSFASSRAFQQIFTETTSHSIMRVKKLRQWIIRAQWDLAAEPQRVCAVWHPEATPKLVQTASLWRVYEIAAESVDLALRQLPVNIGSRLRK